METVDVKVAQGTLRGERLEGRMAFRNVPYAAVPFGGNRFRPPQPVAPWTGARDATGPTMGVPQPTMPGDEVGPALSGAEEYGDDCLVLEVHTPTIGGGGLPVMVWIHGGGFIGGSGAGRLYDGGTFARDGVVLVSINYRLHLEGFLYLGPETANLGLLDQIAALQWVQENIAAFGGDPGNVTVFGQSAGGVSVQHLLTMPRARGLFQRVISQSGSSAGAESVEDAERFTQRFGEILGVDPTIEGFAPVPREQLLQGVLRYALEYISPANSGAKAFMISPFRPVLDGEVIPEHPVPAALAGVGADVDLLAGTTRDECTFAMAPFGLLAALNEPWAAFALDAFDVSWDDLAAYRKGTRPDAEPVELIMAAWTDWAFRIPTIRLAEARASHGSTRPTHLYEFTWASPTQRELRSSHAFEMPFVMDRVREVHDALPAAFDFLGADAPQSLADAMHRAWVGFATNGDPGWAPYDLDRRTTMRFDDTSGPVDDLAGSAERELWEGRR